MFTEFREFHLPILRGLVRAARTDTDVFLLTLAGIALTASPRPLRGLGASLIAYVFIRRADMRTEVVAVKLDGVGRVMNKLASQEYNMYVRKSVPQE